jgi:transposase
MGDNRLAPLVLSGAEQRTLEKWAKRRKTAQGLALRARIVLACAEGRSNTAVAARLGISRNTVRKWRDRFLARRLDGLGDEPRPGVPRTITDALVEEVVVRTLEETPEGATHWSKRELARQVGISPTSVHRIWRAFELQPWRTEDFKISPDPLLIDKIRDVIGLYLAPPERAAVFAVDEKPQIQALQQTAPVLPMLPGTPERRSHDYVRHGTIDLFAALNTATGKVIGRLSAQHRAVDFRDFPDQIDRQTDPAWHPRDLRQPVRAQGARGAQVAAGPSPRTAALHPDLLLLDQPGRAVVRRIAAPLPGPRHILLPRRSHHWAGRLDQGLERQRPALPVDQDRRPDHRPHLPLLLTHLRTWTLARHAHTCEGLLTRTVAVLAAHTLLLTGLDNAM